MARRKIERDGIGITNNDSFAVGDDRSIDEIAGNNGSNGRVIDTIAGLEVTEPGNAISSVDGNASGSASGSTKGKRGRPAGGGGKIQKAEKVSVAGIESILYSLHMMLAKFTGINELEIDHAESKLLSDAIATVSSHYNTTIDPKIIAWIGLIGVCGSIYGPRFAAYRISKMVEKQN